MAQKICVCTGELFYWTFARNEVDSEEERNKPNTTQAVLDCPYVERIRNSYQLRKNQRRVVSGTTRDRDDGWTLVWQRILLERPTESEGMCKTSYDMVAATRSNSSDEVILYGRSLLHLDYSVQYPPPTATSCSSPLSISLSTSTLAPPWPQNCCTTLCRQCYYHGQ